MLRVSPVTIIVFEYWRIHLSFKISSPSELLFIFSVWPGTKTWNWPIRSMTSYTLGRIVTFWATPSTIICISQCPSISPSISLLSDILIVFLILLSAPISWGWCWCMRTLIHSWNIGTKWFLTWVNPSHQLIQVLLSFDHCCCPFCRPWHLTLLSLMSSWMRLRSMIVLISCCSCGQVRFFSWLIRFLCSERHSAFDLQMPALMSFPTQTRFTSTSDWWMSFLKNNLWLVVIWCVSLSEKSCSISKFVITISVAFSPISAWVWHHLEWNRHQIWKRIW